MSPFETQLESTTRSRDVMQMADAPNTSNVSRYVLALGFTVIGLFGFDAWSSHFLNHDPAAREFFASRTFTLALLMGGALALFVCSIVVAALVTYPARPDGSQVPEDHV